MTVVPAAVAELTELLGDDSVVVGDAAVAAYTGDFSSYRGTPDVVVIPRTAHEVAAVLGLCNRLDVPVVPQGGRTGYSGGATPNPGAVVVSLERLDAIEAVDTHGHTVRVGAGAITQRVHEVCESVGLSWPVDLASRGSSQIGGNIATNAGGIHVVRYGMTRNWVLGLEVATMNGELLAMDRPLVKNNTGWDLSQLFIGSEGTLGIITAALLKLAPAVTERSTSFFALSGTRALGDFVRAIRGAPFPVMAIEYLDRASLEQAARHYDTAPPLEPSSPYYVVVEFELAGHKSSDVESWLGALEVSGIEDAVVARGEKQRAQIWLMREGLGEAWKAMGPGRTHDVSVPVSQAPAFLEGLWQHASEAHPDWRLYGCGHLGDGNIHTHLVAPEGMAGDEREALWTEYDEFVFRRVVDDHGGSVSAEHGIGLAKKPYLSWCRTPAELAIFRQVKAMLDPKGLLNPGKIFD